MCRHLAYLGPPVTLRSVLIDPPHGLYRQSWEPRRQRHGTMNAAYAAFVTGVVSR